MRAYGAGFWSGFFIGAFAVVGCASTFPWRYYGAHLHSRPIIEQDVGKDLADLAYAEGVLYGKTGSNGWPDLPLNDCKPDPDPSPGAPSPGPSPIKLRCITLMDSDFYSLKADDEKCHSDLDACQHPTPSGS